MTKRHFAFWLVLAMLWLSACQPATSVPAAAAETPAAGETPLRVANIVNGVQGDKSFFDSAVRGVNRVQQEHNIQVRTIETGYDPARWKPALEDAAAGEYDVIISGGDQMKTLVEQVAPRFPDKKFILYDEQVDYAACGCANVYSVTYKQNEGAYLAGLYAGLMSKSGMVGAIGGQEIPVIQDFIAGYRHGAADAGIPAENVIVRFSGSWDDPARGEEIATEMYAQGVDVIFQITGGTGVGVFQAAQKAGKYAIGVDSDQAAIIAETNPEQARHILTSMLKNVDYSLYRALRMHLNGQLPYGRGEALGVADGGVGLAHNQYYEDLTPQPVKDRILRAEADLLAGKIIVQSAY